MTGYWVSQAVYVAARLSIADLLADGLVDCEDLASATDTHAPSLQRVLRVLASIGVFTEVSPAPLRSPRWRNCFGVRRPARCECSPSCALRSRSPRAICS